MGRAVIATMVGVLVTVGCGGDGSASPTVQPTTVAPTTESEIVTSSVTSSDEASSPSTDGTTIDVLVIGDSLINPSGHCAGCVGFADQYAAIVGQQLGRPTQSALLTAMGVPEAQQLVASNASAEKAISESEVVILETGFNNALPDPTTGIGCAGTLDSPSAYIAWILASQPGCLEEGVATYGQLYDEILAGLKRLREGKPTVFIVTNTIDGNIDPSFSDGLLALAGGDVDAVKAWTVASYDRWNTMLAQRAEAAGFQLVDLYHAFNGPEGTQPSGTLAVDSAHPSQKGHDLIASTLAEADLSALAG
jgi:lysophospholipase L1-like esterase